MTSRSSQRLYIGCVSVFKMAILLSSRTFGLKELNLCTAARFYTDILRFFVTENVRLKSRTLLHSTDTY